MRSPFRSLTSALGGVVGTKRVRELGYTRARVSTVVLAKESDFQRDRARACPRVDARPSLVVLS
jgi:hypothetical protein